MESARIRIPTAGAFCGTRSHRTAPRLANALDANGQLPGQYWPRAYNEDLDESRNAMRVGGSGSGGEIGTRTAVDLTYEFPRGADFPAVCVAAQHSDDRRYLRQWVRPR
jgi:hypothetical protein